MYIQNCVNWCKLQVFNDYIDSIITLHSEAFSNILSNTQFGDKMNPCRMHCKSIILTWKSVGSRMKPCCDNTGILEFCDLSVKQFETVLRISTKVLIYDERARPQCLVTFLDKSIAVWWPNIIRNRIHWHQKKSGSMVHVPRRNSVTGSTAENQALHVSNLKKEGMEEKMLGERCSV